MAKTFSEMLQTFASHGAVTSMKEDGYSVVGRTARGPQYLRLLQEAASLVGRVYSGSRRAALDFQEAMTTSDFPFLFGDILDRQILAAYQETPYTWPQYCRRGTIRDFRVAKRFRIDGGSAVLDGPIVAAGTAPNRQTAGSGSTGLEQLSEYPEGRLYDAKYEIFLEKFGRRMPFAWETMINDDLDALKDTPARFGRAARRTEEAKVTRAFANNTSFFSTANKNVVKAAVKASPTGLGDNPAFSISALQWAMLIMMSQVDTEGEPISIESWTLVFPPALKVPVMNVLNSSQVWMNDSGGTIGGDGSLQRLIADNWAKNVVNPALNYYLPIVDLAHGNTGWYLFANPANGRPALELAFLTGHEQPETFMRLPNQVRIGEGSMGPGAGAGAGTINTNPIEGDFDSDSIHYKVRHVLGTATLDPIMAVYSNGSGS